jgi:hypothetical protein
MNATIKIPPRFYFTRLTPRQKKQNNSSLFRKKKRKARNERVTPEFGEY